MLFEERCGGSIMSHIGGGLEEPLRYAVELKLQSRKLRTCCAPMLTLVRRATCSAKDGEHSQFLQALGLGSDATALACLLAASSKHEVELLQRRFDAEQASRALPSLREVRPMPARALKAPFLIAVCKRLLSRTITATVFINYLLRSLAYRLGMGLVCVSVKNSYFSRM